MKQIALLLVVLLLYSCNIINPSEQEPAYMTIKDFSVEANANQGGNTENVKDVWVYVNSKLVGAYQIPATFPVLEEGEQLVEIFAGIKVNGISEFPEQYGFYKRYTTTIDFKGGEEVEVSPIFSYSESAIFSLVEQFSSPAHQMTFDGDGTASDAGLTVVSSAGSLDGSSGYIELDTMNYFFDLGSKPLEDFPFNAKFYLEMDYKTDVPINVGLVGYGLLNEVVGSNFDQGVLPKSEWTKIYFDLSGPMSQLKNLPGINYYRLHFTAALNLQTAAEMPTAEIFIDNLKLIRFE